MIFKLRSRFANCAEAQITKGRYPNGSTAWTVTGDCGEGWAEVIGTPTIALDDLPPEGCVFIKVTDEYRGWLESLEAAGIVQDTGARRSSGYVEEYAAVCRVLKPSLLIDG